MFLDAVCAAVIQNLRVDNLLIQRKSRDLCPRVPEALSRHRARGQPGPRGLGAEACSNQQSKKQPGGAFFELTEVGQE